MNDTDHSNGERVAAVETEIKLVLDGIERIEGRLARIENVVIKGAVPRLETGIARMHRRLTETKDELKSDIARAKGTCGDQGGVPMDVQILAAISNETRAFYAISGIVVVGIIALLLEGSIL